MKKIKNYNIIKTVTKNHILFCGFFGLHKSILRDTVRVVVDEKEYLPRFYFKRLSFKFCRILSNFYILKIPVEDAMLYPINNMIIMQGFDYEGLGYKYNMKFSFIRRNSLYRNTKVRMFKAKDTSIYLRQNNYNTMVITVRAINKTDTNYEQRKINLSYFISHFYPKNSILMYEKLANKYEESASVVFERLIDKGYKNVYFVIGKDSIYLKNIDKKYMKNIIWKHSFKHYLIFFTAKSLISSESPGHALELRTANEYVVKRVYSNKFKYVFLQHGVMYMVSLDSAGRSFFRKGNLMPKEGKIVVSSKLEAQHFIDLGGYGKKDLYITGLPKFDKNEINENPDKIVIMPTWRPFEFNQIRIDYKKSGYYIMIKEIIECIPKNLQDKIIVLPHPLFKESIENSKLAKYLKNDTYDNILKETKVLITDYSSIAYDSFYRGSNVIFWWNEKDLCMKKYNGHLMLNKSNVFGDVCYNKENLKKIIEDNYNNKQKEKYAKRYKKIVEFSDNKNSDRLIKKLIKDDII